MVGIDPPGEGQAYREIEQHHTALHDRLPDGEAEGAVYLKLCQHGKVVVEGQQLGVSLNAFLLSYLMPGVHAPGQRQKDHHVQRQNDQ